MNSPLHSHILNLATVVVAIFLSGCAADGDISEWRSYPQQSYPQQPEDRAYHLFVPDGVLASDQLVPLVINMHGATPAIASINTFASFFQQVISGMPQHAANNNYISVHPQGRTYEETQFWVTSDERDADFINGLVDDLIETLPVDPQRIFLTGFSSGGIMAWKLACEHSDRYAAIAAVAANRRAAEDCPDARAVPVIAFHGTDDQTVGYDGGITALETWAEEHDCQAREVVFQENDSTCERWSECNQGSEMRFCTSEEAGHTWPSGPGSFVISAAGYGRTSYSIDATDLMWSFFEAVSLQQ